MFNRSNDRLPFYVAIIRENKTIPHLPNEIFLMIDEEIERSVIRDHQRRFIFRHKRILPFERIFTVYCHAAYWPNPYDAYHVRVPSFRIREARASGIYYNTVKRIFNITNIVTIIDKEDDTIQHYCRNSLLESKSLDKYRF